MAIVFALLCDDLMQKMTQNNWNYYYIEVTKKNKSRIAAGIMC